MKILKVEPGKKPEIAEIDGTLKSMQNIVGGYIEEIKTDDETAALIVNEEGKIDCLPLNRCLIDSNGNLVDIIAGTFFVIGIKYYDNYQASDFCDLSPEMIEKYSERFQYGEKFYRCKSTNEIIVNKFDETGRIVYP